MSQKLQAGKIQSSFSAPSPPCSVQEIPIEVQYIVYEFLLMERSESAKTEELRGCVFSKNETDDEEEKEFRERSTEAVSFFSAFNDLEYP